MGGEGGVGGRFEELRREEAGHKRRRQERERGREGGGQETEGECQQKGQSSEGGWGGAPVAAAL